MKILTLPESVDLSGILMDETLYRIGKLENGLTYYIRHNETPKNQCEFRIVQKVGSLQEEEHQRGLAHFLEHMAFEGTEHFPGNKMREYLEDNGMAWGSDLNAYTSFDRTVYKIGRVPTDKGADILDNCLQILADWSSGILLEDAGIAKERGIIKNEYLIGNDANTRMKNSILTQVSSNSRHSQRLPIGQLSVIENCPGDDIRDFYRKWYHPGNQAVVIVGDIDVDAMENKVKAMFSHISCPENPAPVEVFEMPYAEDPVFATASDKEFSFTTMDLNFKYLNQSFGSGDMVFRSYCNLVFSLLSKMMEVRLMDVESAADTAITYSDCNVGDFFFAPNIHMLTLSATPVAGREEEAYCQMLRTALSIANHGFTSGELDVAKAEVLSRMISALNDADKMKNSTLVDYCVNNYVDGQPLFSMKSNYDFTVACLGFIDLEYMNTLAQRVIHADCNNLVVAVYADSSDKVYHFSSDTLRALTDGVLSETLSHVDSEDFDDVLMRDIPEPGSIVSEFHDDVMGCDGFVLQNGAQVEYKVTDYSNDEISICAYSKINHSIFDDSLIPYSLVLSDAITSVGLASYNESQLGKFIKGKDISYSFASSPHGVTFTITTSVRDLESAMQILYCVFTRPGNCETDFQNFVKKKHLELDAFNNLPEFILMKTMLDSSLVDNSRQRLITHDELNALKLETLREMYLDLMSDASAFRFSFVGNVDPQLIKPLAATYIASLPASNMGKRNDLSKYNEARRYVHFSARTDMENPIGAVLILMYCPDFDYTLFNELSISMVCEILDKRFEKAIREDSSISYNAGMEHKVAPQFTNDKKISVQLMINSMVNPQYTEFCRKLMHSVWDEAYASGFGKAELSREIKHTKKMRQQALRQNGSWTTWMRYRHKYGIDYLNGFDEVLDSIDVEALNVCFRRIYENAVRQTYLLAPNGVEQLMAIN